MNLVKNAFILLLSVIIFSCSKDSDIPVAPTENPDYRISSKSYYFSDKSANEIKFFYNSARQLTKKEEHNAKGEISFYENHLYSNGKLLKIERGTDKGKFGEFRYRYKDNTIKAIEYWLADADSILKKSHQVEYEYQNGVITKSRSTFTNGNTPYYALYTYTNGNITSIKTYDQATNQLIEEDLFFYDDKINPFYNTTNEYLGQPIASSRNNVIFSQIFSSKHMPVNATLLFEFKYNEKGYPVEKYIKGKADKSYIEESYTYTN